MLKCMCGGEAEIELIIDIKEAFLGGNPLKGRCRVVCKHCGQGTGNVKGSKTQAEAVSAWERSMQEITELAEEFHVTPKEFVEKINAAGNRSV